MMKTNPEQYRQKRTTKPSFGNCVRGLLSLSILSLSLPVSAVVWPQPESAYHSTQRHPQWIEPPKVSQAPISTLSGQGTLNQGMTPQNGFSAPSMIPQMPTYGGYGRQPNPSPYYGEYYGSPYQNREQRYSWNGFPNFGNWNMPNTFPNMPSVPSMSAPSFNFPSFGW